MIVGFKHFRTDILYLTYLTILINYVLENYAAAVFWFLTSANPTCYFTFFI